MTRWLPPIYRAPVPSRCVRPLDPGRPTLRQITIALLALLASLLGWGIAWALLLPG